MGDPDERHPGLHLVPRNGLTGMEPGVPGLVGLRPNYIAAQLVRWRVGGAWRPIRLHEAHRDAPADADPGVAAWLRQKPLADAAPEKSNVVRMPLACGSQR
jgi:hypothetical protein